MLEIVPLGYCHCGCGQRTLIARHTHSSQGIKAGRPNRYLKGHTTRKAKRCPFTKRERKAAYDRARYVERREERIRQATDWVRRNPERARANYRRQRLIRRKALTPAAVEFSRILVQDPCTYCGGPASELDHIVPLALGGGGDTDNLTAACRTCNARKNDSPLLYYLLGRS